MLQYLVILSNYSTFILLSFSLTKHLKINNGLLNFSKMLRVPHNVLVLFSDEKLTNPLIFNLHTQTNNTTKKKVQTIKPGF